MRIVNSASEASALAGYKIYKNNAVKSCKQTGNGIYHGTVVDTDDKANVTLNVEHPRSTACDCAFARGRKVICKHAVALYFAAFTNAAQEFETEREQIENERCEWIKNRIKLGYYDIK